jgi:hypothetical protein
VRRWDRLFGNYRRQAKKELDRIFRPVLYH